jgi:hypothetical protein
MEIKMELVDNDHAVRAKTALAVNGEDHPFANFLRQVREELVAGQTAYLEIEGFNMDPITFEITQFE